MLSKGLYKMKVRKVKGLEDQQLGYGLGRAHFSNLPARMLDKVNHVVYDKE